MTSEPDYCTLAERTGGLDAAAEACLAEAERYGSRQWDADDFRAALAPHWPTEPTLADLRERLEVMLERGTVAPRKVYIGSAHSEYSVTFKGAPSEHGARALVSVEEIRAVLSALAAEAQPGEGVGECR